MGWCIGQSPYAGGQEVHYRIAAKLDTGEHVLLVDMEMKYINHSRDTLHEIYLHLWANAYRDESTTFARELLHRGETQFHFSATEDRGGYEELEIRIESTPLSLQLTKEPDIGQLALHQALLPGDTIRLDFSYTLRIPLSFSRLGRATDSYQLTQWYPKPAVYKNGNWMAFPYADQGEFFSEFGQFDVSLNAPADFMVGATGRPDSISRQRLERVALSQQHYAKYLDSFPSLTERLQWCYRADSVHDFALFLDRDFRVDHALQEVEVGREIDLWAFYTRRQAELWRHATRYMSEALDFFSEEIGAYPYPQFTGVEGALSSGAGMEYPMITVIGESEDGKELDRVLAHELGHSWWYGILASNERADPWIDEGLTSCYENLYMMHRYPEGILTLDDYWRGRNWSLEDAICSHQHRQGKWQPPGLSSEAFTPLNYYLANYYWAPRNFLHLRAFVGPKKFQAAIRAYFSTYSFSHIDKKGLQQFLEESLEENLDWLFVQGVEHGKFPNYSLHEVDLSGDSLYFEIRNSTSVKAPLCVGFFSKDSLQALQWMRGFSGKKNLRRAVPAGSEAVVINPGSYIVETRIKDNVAPLPDASYSFPKWQTGLVPVTRSAHRNQLFMSPHLRITSYDNISAGMLLHNLSFPNRAFQFYATPTVNPINGAFSATTRLRYSFSILKEVDRSLYLRLGVDSRYLPYADMEEKTFRYFRWQPYMQWDYEQSRYRHRLEIRSHHIELEAARPEPSLGTSYLLPEIYYLGVWTHPLRRYLWESWTTFLPDHLRLGTKFSFRQAYAAKRYWNVRLYAGWIPENYTTVPQEARLQAGRFTGVDDFRFSEQWVGRSAPAGRGFHGLQSSQREGTLKSPFQPDIAISFLSTAEFRVDAPWRWLPLALYVDVGYIRGADPQTGDSMDTPWLISPGLSLSFLDRSLEIHFPFGFLESSLLERYRPAAYENWTWPVYVNFSFRWDMDLFFELDRRIIRP